MDDRAAASTLFDAHELAVLFALAEAATPPGDTLPPPAPEMTGVIELVLADLGLQGAYRAMLRALDVLPRATTGRSFRGLDRDRRERFLLELNARPATAHLVKALTMPVKLARSQTSAVFRELDEPRRGLRVVEEPARWKENVSPLTESGELEVDVVVVGTGAGGAPVAATLAARGHAVLMLEEGQHFTRKDFTAGPFEMQRRMYRPISETTAIGNALIPIPVGRTVGGSTTINSGTCFRTPDRVLYRWQTQLGLRDLGPAEMERYFARVEAIIGVERAEAKTLGGCARVIARGAEALGYSHGPLRRNAPGCDAQAVCCFGCPTDAKRSTNVSYVPEALKRGALCMTGARVERILTEGGRAVGVVARGTGADGAKVELSVRARAVILAGGTFGTPLLLEASGLARGSGQLGRNLSIHPASHSMARFEEAISGYREIPQGYEIDQFASEGIRFEGGFPPIDIGAATFGRVGRAWTELVEAFAHVAVFGFMIEDTSRGAVSLGPGGRPLIRYWLNDEDRRKVVRGQAILARVYLAAGAQTVMPGILGVDELRSMADADRLEAEADRISAHQLELTAYHPLGTCRMGVRASDSVVGPDHEVHDVEQLYVVDGSVIPSSLGVNPQVTIMALAERAGERIDRRLAANRPRPSAVRTPLEFQETMSGTLRAPSGRLASVVFRLKASELEPSRKWTEAVFRLEGVIELEGVTPGSRAEGTLTMRPLAGMGGLRYDLRFVDADGRRLRLLGLKHTSLRRPWASMTTLYTEVRAESGELVGEGTMLFHARDLYKFARSFTTAPALAPQTAG